jgi:hypothetical protein
MINYVQDLVVLAADKQIQFALRGAFTRPQALGIRTISFDFRTHPGRDGGVRTTGASVIAGERNRFHHALMVLDLEGCGDDADDPVALEADLDAQLRSVWKTRAKTIVVDPEVEVWLWGADAVLREVLGWRRHEPVRDWLRANGFVLATNDKPARPKEALDAIQRLHREPRSAALYERITSRISLQKCKDPGFLRLRSVLQAWFGTEGCHRRRGTTRPADPC